ncbi:MAG TPA: hypothetical protein VMY42_21990 [Thermoguttaceae bacterium]|nr:hypothetical protein [Thermoguttaceae bacterium]
MDLARNERPGPSKCLVAIVWVLVLGYVVCFALQTRDYFIDDAYIGFQYVRNLLAGHGFVFQPGDAPVEGVTNIGWLLLLTPLAAITEPTTAAKALGFVLVIAALALTFLLGRHLAARFQRREGFSSLVLVPLVLLASSFDFLYFTLAGMETGLLAVVLLVMAWIAVRRPGSLWLPVLGAIAFLIHPEAIVTYPLYSLLLRPPQVNRRRAWSGNLLLAVLVGALTAIRWGYFHDVVPNTFHSKPSHPFQILVNGYQFIIGANANFSFPITGWLAVPIFGFGYYRLRRAAPAAAGMLGAIAATGLAFCVYSPPDWTGMGRYLAPYLPAVLLLFWVGLVEVVHRLFARVPQPLARPLAVAMVVVLLVATGLLDRAAKMARMETFPGYVLAGKNLVGPSLWIRDHLPDDATIATRRIGALAYYGGRSIFDYAFGLPDREVARLVAEVGGRFQSPGTPALAPLWQARAPDYLLEDADMMELIISQAGGTQDRFSIHGLDYGVMRHFQVGKGSRWVLACRIESPSQLPRTIAARQS